MTKLKTKVGDAKLQKTDIFRKIMWFGYDGENTWHPIDALRVAEIKEMNEKGVIPETLTLDELEIKDLSDVGINRDLEKMDKKFKQKDKGQNQGGQKGNLNSKNKSRSNKNRNRNNRKNKNNRPEK